MMRADQDTGRGIQSAVGAKESQGTANAVMQVTTHGRMKDAADRMIADHQVRDVGREPVLGRVTRVMEEEEFRSRMLSTSLETVIIAEVVEHGGDALVRTKKVMRAMVTEISTIGLGLTKRAWTAPKVIMVRIRREEWCLT